MTAFEPTHTTPGGVELDLHWQPDLRIVAAQFDQYAEMVSNFAVPLAEVAVLASKDARARFEREGYASPGDWPDWSDDYKAIRDQLPGEGTTILDLTGRMRAHASDPASYEVDVAGGFSAGFGELHYVPDSELDYYHQEGTSKMPARPFIGLASISQSMIAFEQWLDAVFADFGTGVRPGESMVVLPGVGIRFRGAGGKFVSSKR